MRGSIGNNAISLLLALALPTQSVAETVEFFYSSLLDRCSWSNQSFHANNHTAKGGLCARIPSVDRIYACPASDGGCWTFATTCANGKDPGSQQIKCSNVVKDKDWCCSDEETCTVHTDKVNACVAKFANPLQGVSTVVAQQQEYSAIPSTAISTGTHVQATPSVFSTSTFALDGSDGTSKTLSATDTWSGTASAAAESSAPSRSGSISGGAIAGIVVGALAGLALVCSAIILLVHHRRKARKVSLAASGKGFDGHGNNEGSLASRMNSQPSSGHSYSDHSANEAGAEQPQHQPETYPFEAPTDAAVPKGSPYELQDSGRTNQRYELS